MAEKKAEPKRRRRVAVEGPPADAPSEESAFAADSPGDEPSPEELDFAQAEDQPSSRAIRNEGERGECEGIIAGIISRSPRELNERTCSLPSESHMVNPFTRPDASSSSR